MPLTHLVSGRHVVVCFWPVPEEVAEARPVTVAVVFAPPGEHGVAGACGFNHGLQIS